MDIKILKQTQYANRTLKVGYEMTVTSELGLMWIKEGIAEVAHGHSAREQKAIRENVKQDKQEIHIHIQGQEEE